MKKFRVRSDLLLWVLRLLFESTRTQDLLRYFEARIVVSNLHKNTKKLFMRFNHPYLVIYSRSAAQRNTIDGGKYCGLFHYSVEDPFVSYLRALCRITNEEDEIYKVCSEIGRPSQREVDRHEHVLLAKKFGVLKLNIVLVV
ncbi:hypothetical protein C5167_027459 [Papaver somniferum]|nr:hypothetical protein C5167_027459 [Papaver somniferum]